MQVKEERYRVPDVCVLSADAPKECIIHHPPLLCMEVLSPSDTMTKMHDRVRDYVEMGVRQVWLLDTERRTATVCTGNLMTDHVEGRIGVPGTLIDVAVEEMFSALDEQ